MEIDEIMQKLYIAYSAMDQVEVKRYANINNLGLAMRVIKEILETKKEEPTIKE